MSAAVWKYRLRYPLTTVAMPAGAKLLHVGVQEVELFTTAVVWALVNPDETQMIERQFMLVPTGHPFYGEGMDYVGTVLLDDGAFVLHVFERQP